MTRYGAQFGPDITFLGVDRVDLDDADALAAARDGARRARDELTWDAAAAAHLALYEEIT